jgi:hypothetical protein
MQLPTVAAKYINEHIKYINEHIQIVNANGEKVAKPDRTFKRECLENAPKPVKDQKHSNAK